MRLLLGAPHILLPALVAYGVPQTPMLSPLRCMATPDPFRPARPPLEPLAINAIQELLSGASPPEDVAQKAIEVRYPSPQRLIAPSCIHRAAFARRRVPKIQTTSSRSRRSGVRTQPVRATHKRAARSDLRSVRDRRLLRRRIVQVGTAREPILALLEAVVAGEGLILLPPLQLHFSPEAPAPLAPPIQTRHGSASSAWRHSLALAMRRTHTSASAAPSACSPCYCSCAAARP